MIPADPSSLIKKVSPYVNVYVVFWLVMGFIWWMHGYKESFLMVNSWHSPWLDYIMPHLTHLGDGALVISLLGLWVVRKNPALAVSMIAALILLTFMVQGLKEWIFSDWGRPLSVFKEGSAFHYVATEVLRFHAFPSGHSATAAALFAFPLLALHNRGQAVGLGGLAILSCLVCYSRVYIGVHFVGDIVVGSFIGMIAFFLSAQYIYPKLYSRLRKKPEAYVERLVRKLVWTFSILLILSFIHLYLVHYA